MIVDVNFAPILAQFGPFQISWTSVFTTVGMLLAYGLAYRRLTRRGVSATAIGQVASLAILGGLVGARLLHVAEHLPYYRAVPGEVLAVSDGGVSIWGAWLGGIGAGIVAAKLVHLPIWHLLDNVIPAVLGGQAVGLIGYLLTGAIWGAPTSGDRGIIYWNPRDALPPGLLGVPLQPYPLYEIVGIALLLVVLNQAGQLLARRPGWTTLGTAIIYPTLQLGLAALRHV